MDISCNKGCHKKSVDVIEKYFENLNNIKDFDHNKEKKISNNLFSLIEEIEKDKKYSSVSFNNKDVNTLLKYVELYFSEPSNYNKLDYLNFNEPILNNLYNWYYNELKKPDQINTYCNKLENIINSMEQLLTREKNTTIQKCNIICTIAKTKIIINKLINSKYNIDEELELIAKLTEENFTTYTSVEKKLKEEFKSSH